VEVDHVGLNHLTWIREVRVAMSMLPRVLDEHVRTWPLASAAAGPDP
jgi:alpha-galactosidase/6-phospho-beta-glucosidase family protein